MASACTGAQDSAATRPLAYRIRVDAPSTEGVSFLRFFPATVRVAPGDSIRFEAEASFEHTVTFGLDGAGTTPPCAVGTETGAFDGTGVWNSGCIVGEEVDLFVDPSAAAGRYVFVCLLHPGVMTGAIDVVGATGERDEPQEVVARGEKEIERLRVSASFFTEPPGPLRVGDGTAVVAGWGAGAISVNRFEPEEIRVAAGDAVTWEVAHDRVAGSHTVTLGSFQKPAAAHPQLPQGATYDGTGFAHSGILGVGSRYGDDFSLTFNQAGTYRYRCVLHPGRDGVVEVGTVHVN